MRIIVALAICLVIFGCRDREKADTIQYACLNIKIEDAGPDDTLTLLFWQDVLSPNLSDGFIEPMIYKTEMNDAGLFSFRISTANEPGYFIVSKDDDRNYGGPVPIMDRYLIGPGDSVTITIKKRPADYSYKLGWNYSGLNDLYKTYTLEFDGKGAYKYRYRYMIDTTIAKDTTPYYLFPLHDNIYIVKNHYKKSKDIVDSILRQGREHVPFFIYQIIAIDFYAKLEIKKILLFSNKYKIVSNKKNVAEQKYLKEIFDEYFNFNWIDRFDKNALAKSNYFASYLFHKSLITTILSGKDVDKDTYDCLKGTVYYNEELHDKVVSLFLAKKYGEIGNLSKPLEEAINTINTPYCLKALKRINAVLTKGVLAFNFSLPDSAGRLFTLDDFKGKVVVMDFWFYGCGSCAKLYKYVLSKAERYYEGNPNVVFVSVSIDKLKERWMTGMYSHQYTSLGRQNVINLYTGGTGGEKEVIRHYNISGYPFVILIDQDGRIFNTTSDVLRRLGGLKGQIDRLLSR